MISPWNKTDWCLYKDHLLSLFAGTYRASPPGGAGALRAHGRLDAAVPVWVQCNQEPTRPPPRPSHRPWQPIYFLLLHCSSSVKLMFFAILLSMNVLFIFFFLIYFLQKIHNNILSQINYRPIWKRWCCVFLIIIKNKKRPPLGPS